MVDIREQSPINLAFVGDAVFSLLVRQKLVSEHRYQPSKLHRETSNFVSAAGQSVAYSIIEPILTQEEKNIFLRGRNASKMSVAKHASPEQYRCSTGFESLMGWLYLNDNISRIWELFDVIWNQMHSME